MCRLLFVFLLLGGVATRRLLAQVPPQAPVTPAGTLDRALESELVTILGEDQKYRLQIGAVQKKSGGDSTEMRELWKVINEKDAANLVRVEAILDRRGWLGPGEVGPQGNVALFLVIQHADLKTQEKYLPMIRLAVKAGRAQASQLALLEDRVALGEGRRQTYGSQIGMDEAGAAHVRPLEDPDQVDRRRASVGLGPLAEYVRQWGITWDAEAYKRQLPQLEAAKPW